MRSFLEDLTPTLLKSKVLISFLLDELEIVYVKNADVKKIPKVVETSNEAEISSPQPQTRYIKTEMTEVVPEFILPEESHDVATNDNVEEELTFEDLEVKEDPLDQEMAIDEINENLDQNVEIDSNPSNQRNGIPKSRKRKNDKESSTRDPFHYDPAIYPKLWQY